MYLLIILYCNDIHRVIITDPENRIEMADVNQPWIMYGIYKAKEYWLIILVISTNNFNILLKSKWGIDSISYTKKL